MILSSFRVEGPRLAKECSRCNALHSLAPCPRRRVRQQAKTRLLKVFCVGEKQEAVRVYFMRLNGNPAPVCPSTLEIAKVKKHRRTRSFFLHTQDDAGECMGGSASNKMNNDAHESQMSGVLIKHVLCAPVCSVGTLRRAHTDAQWSSTVANKKPKGVLLHSQLCCSFLGTLCMYVCMCACV